MQYFLTIFTLHKCLYFVLILIFFFLETRFHSVAQAGFELMGNLLSQSSKCHHTQTFNNYLSSINKAEEHICPRGTYI